MTELLHDVLKRFARTLTGRFDVSEVLYELTQRSVEILRATSAGVSLASPDGTLMFAAASAEAAAELERSQQELQEGPCYEAFRTSANVFVEDLSRRTEWPGYRKTAERAGMSSVAGIPLVSGDVRVGALDVYSAEPRKWESNDVAAAETIAHIATAYLLNSSQLEDARRLNGQLQEALDARVLIEQAKGMLAGERGISVDSSFEMLRQHARRNSATLRAVADAVVNLGLRP